MVTAVEIQKNRMYSPTSGEWDQYHLLPRKSRSNHHTADATAITSNTRRVKIPKSYLQRSSVAVVNSNTVNMNDLEGERDQKQGERILEQLLNEEQKIRKRQSKQRRQDRNPRLLRPSRARRSPPPDEGALVQYEPFLASKTQTPRATSNQIKKQRQSKNYQLHRRSFTHQQQQLIQQQFEWEHQILQQHQEPQQQHQYRLSGRTTSPTTTAARRTRTSSPILAVYGPHSTQAPYLLTPTPRSIPSTHVSSTIASEDGVNGNDSNNANQVETVMAPSPRLRARPLPLWRRRLAKFRRAHPTMTSSTNNNTDAPLFTHDPNDLTRDLVVDNDPLLDALVCVPSKLNGDNDTTSVTSDLSGSFLTRDDETATFQSGWNLFSNWDTSEEPIKPNAPSAWESLRDALCGWTKSKKESEEEVPPESSSTSSPELQAVADLLFLDYGDSSKSKTTFNNNNNNNNKTTQSQKLHRQDEQPADDATVSTTASRESTLDQRNVTFGILVN